MSFAKRLMEKQEAKRQAAIAIAIRGKVLRVCEFHDDIIMQGTDEPAHAYAVGNQRFTAGELNGVFTTRTQMTDAVKAVIEEFVLDYCPRCDKLLAD